MKLEIPAFRYGQPVPEEHAFNVPADIDHATFGPNISPLVRWSDPPAGTRSFALLVHDPDVPSRGDDVNQEGRLVPPDLPRVDFFHWVLVDIPPSLREIPAGAESGGVTTRGKPIGPTPHGVRGVNDYTGWFAGDPDMTGNYGGYDGPCPPWNDTILHHYHFTLFALDVATIGLAGAFTGHDARKAMQGHILAEAVHMGTYALNPDLR